MPVCMVLYAYLSGCFHQSRTIEFALRMQRGQAASNADYLIQGYSLRPQNIPNPGHSDVFKDFTVVLDVLSRRTNNELAVTGWRRGPGLFGLWSESQALRAIPEIPKLVIKMGPRSEKREYEVNETRNCGKYYSGSKGLDLPFCWAPLHCA